MDLVALDHDMTKGSLTPSVVLNCDIPDTIDGSFVRGKVTTIINDSVFETASPFRHTAVLAKLLSAKPPPIVLKFTDGGTDQRNTLESVRCADICLFKELEVDMLIHARCAPGMSYTNPAERVMSILNLGLQNVSLERKRVDEKVEALLKNKNSLKEVCAANDNYPDLNVKQGWVESLEPLKSLIRNRFLRLKLKDDPVQAMDPVSDEDIDILKRHLREMFPDLDTNKLQKQHTKKIATYQKWLEDHCKMTQYVFQVRKCNNPSCCLPAVIPNLGWLPDPTLDESGEHFQPYASLKSVDTTENDRPSLKKNAEKTMKKTGHEQGNTTPPPASESTTESEEESFVQMPVSDSSLCTVQNARSLCSCVECGKPRVVFSKHKLTMRQQMAVVLDISEYDYSCGSPLLPPSNPLHKTVMCKTTLSCQSTVELAYYKSGLGIATLCCYCCSEEGHVNGDLLKQFKTVLPLCQPCADIGRTPIVQRPFGKKS